MRTIRKTLVTSPDEQDPIDAYLLKLNQQRRRQRQKTISFNTFAIEAIQEKIAREELK